MNNITKNLFEDLEPKMAIIVYKSEDDIFYLERRDISSDGIMGAGVSLGHPGIQVHAYDHDEVTSANIGRQLFSQSDIGLNKANVLVTRINRFFGTDWTAIPFRYGEGDYSTANICISCVDNVA